MDPATALQVAARRYCLDRYQMWCDRYAEIVRRNGDRASDGFNYSTEALATFPRYLVLDAIRIDIETLDPEALNDVEETRAFLALAGQTASGHFDRNPEKIAQRAIAEERDEFRRFLGAISPSDLNAVEPLPYRRVLTGEELSKLRERLAERWGIDPYGYWHPLAECSLPDVMAFQEQAFGECVSAHQLRHLLISRGIARVWEISEWGPSYIQDVVLLNLGYFGPERYWSSSDMDWLLYQSHENSVTVGGWLLEQVRSNWPTWADALWTGP